MVRRAMRSVLVTVLVSCSPILPLRPDASVSDAGTAGGTAGGVTATGGGVTAGGATAGGITAGGEAGGAGAGGIAGGLVDAGASFAWTRVGLPEGINVRHLASRAGETYAVSYARDVLRSTGGPFTKVPTLDVPLPCCIDVSPSGRVIVLSTDHWSRVCTSGCDDGANYVDRRAADSSVHFMAVCSHGEDVWALASGTAQTGMLFRFENDQWRRVELDVGVGSAQACAVMPDGSVLIVGTTGVASYTNVVTPQQVMVLGQAARWRAMAVSWKPDGGVGGAMLAGGFGAYRSALRPAGAATWNELAPDSQGLELLSIAALGLDTFLAVGDPRQGGGRYLAFRDGGWSPVAGPDELEVKVLGTRTDVYLSGVVGGEPSLLRLER